MKLKKIASLALAGVMAVGMLAGCSTTPSTPNDPETPVVTNGISADVKARIEANDVDIPEYVTFADDTDLDEALTYAVQYAGVKEVADGYINVVHQLEPVFNRNINSELAEAVSDYTGVNAADFDFRFCHGALPFLDPEVLPCRVLICRIKAAVGSSTTRP